MFSSVFRYCFACFSFHSREARAVRLAKQVYNFVACAALVSCGSHSEAKIRVGNISMYISLGRPQFTSASVTQMCIVGLPGNATSSANDMFYSNSVYYRWIATNFSVNWKRTASTRKFHSASGWKSLPGKITIETPLPREWRLGIQREQRRRVRGFQILVWTNFPQMYLWIHDKYSSTSFKQRVWQGKML